MFMPMVNASRDANPACSYSSFNDNVKVPLVIQVGQPRTAGSVRNHVATAVLYDASGTHAECVRDE